VELGCVEKMVHALFRWRRKAEKNARIHSGKGGKHGYYGGCMFDGKHSPLTERIIGCFYAAYNELGYGYNEAVYARALEIVFRSAGISARKEHPIDVVFRGERIASFRVDFLVEDTVVLELKAGAELSGGTKSQLVTYLKSAKKDVGLILYFGPDPDVKRVVL
jgi:GxxExxY protein